MICTPQAGGGGQGYVDAQGVRIQGLKDGQKMDILREKLIFCPGGTKLLNNKRKFPHMYSDPFLSVLVISSTTLVLIRGCLCRRRYDVS